jgi:hypothetical protein
MCMRAFKVELGDTKNYSPHTPPWDKEVIAVWLPLAIQTISNGVYTAHQAVQLILQGKVVLNGLTIRDPDMAIGPGSHYISVAGDGGYTFRVNTLWNPITRDVWAELANYFLHFPASTQWISGVRVHLDVESRTLNVCLYDVGMRQTNDSDASPLPGKMYTSCISDLD